jgi:hypothetical protein
MQSTTCKWQLLVDPAARHTRARDGKKAERWGWKMATGTASDNTSTPKLHNG